MSDIIFAINKHIFRHLFFDSAQDYDLISREIESSKLVSFTVLRKHTIIVKFSHIFVARERNLQNLHQFGSERY